MKKGLLILGILFSLFIISLGIFGMINSKNKKLTENDEIDVNELYNYILGFEYKHINDNGENIEVHYYSDIHQDYKVTVDNLGTGVILRNAIKQLVKCNGEYEDKDLPYEVVKNKIKEIVGKDISIENLGTSMYMGTSETGYSCTLDGCILIGGGYCSEEPLTTRYTMLNHKIENNNIIIIDKDIASNKYKHTFTKDTNGNYYWSSSEPYAQ